MDDKKLNIDKKNIEPLMDLPDINLPELEIERKTVQDFMRDLVQASNIVREYLIITACVVPTEGIDKKAMPIIMGHMVRLAKLYDTLILLVVEKRDEMAMILQRSLVETIINLKFIIANGSPEYYEKYRKASLAYEKKYWEELNDLPIPQRLKDKIQSRITETIESAGYTMDQIDWSDRNWGMPLYKKAEQVNLIELYEFGFRTGSHYTHGTWHDLEFQHLTKTDDGNYEPELRYSNSKPQIITGPTFIVIEIAIEYLEYISGEASAELRESLVRLAAWFKSIDLLHERHRGVII